LCQKEDNLTFCKGSYYDRSKNCAGRAQNNGNANWDSGFEFFCDFLQSTLCNSDALNHEEKAHVSSALQRIKSAGQLALRFYDSEIPDEEFEHEIENSLDTTAYLDDDLYDLICDAIGAFYVKNPTPIPYEPNPDIYR